MTTVVLSSNQCRAKAQELREKAMKTRDPVVRKQFLELVKQYELLAAKLRKFQA